MDTTAKRIARNTLWLLSLAVAGRALSFILIIYLARKLGDLNFGKFCFAGAFVQIFIMIADLGVSTLMIREVARDRGNVDKYFSNGFFIKVILALLTFGLIVIFANISKSPADTRALIYLIGLCNILESMGTFYGSIFRAFERMKYLFFAEMTEKALRVLFCFISLSLGYGLISIAFIYLLSAVLYLGLNIILLSGNIGKFSLRLDIVFAWDLFRESLPFALGGLLGMFYYYIDALMLGMMKGELVVGWYSAGYQLYLALGIMASVFLTAVFPVMSRLSKTSLGSLRKVYEKCFKYLLVLGVPLSISGALLGKRIIFLFYGHGYLNSVLPFQLIVSVIAFSHINSLFGYYLTATDRLRDKNKLFAVCALTNAGLNFALIPQYSYTGAAIATITSEILFCVFGMIYINRYCFSWFPGSLIFKTLSASALMGIFIKLFPEINLALLISSGLAIYCVALWLFGYFDKEDKLLFREVISG